MHEQEAYRNLRHNVRVNTIQGIFQVVTNNLTQPFIPLFAIKVLEASDSQVAWLSSLPALTGILVLLPGAFFIDRLLAKKRFTGTTIYMARFFFLALAMLPFFPVSNYWLAWLFVVLVALMNVPFSLYNLSWQAFIGDVIPAVQRAKVFGMRNRVTQGIGMIVTILTGMVVAWIGDADAWVYQVLFGLAFLFGITEASTLMRIREPQREMSVKASQSLTTMLPTVFRERRFLIFASASAMFHFGWQMAWPLFNIYQVSPEYVNMSGLWVSIISVCNGLAGVATYRMWGKVADRIGHGWTLVIGTAGLSTAPLLYSFTMNLYALAAMNLWMGIFVACTVQTLFNRVLEVSPQDNRAFFIAMHSMFIGITAIFAPQFGVWVKGLTSIETAFQVSTGLRFAGAVALGLVVLWERRQRRMQRGFDVGS